VALAALLALLVCLLSATVRAAPTAVVVEIDPAAERLVDARSTRRLVPLELSDVQVPNAAGRGASTLFFRVLGRQDGTLRIELWERGEYHGQRSLSGTGANPQLVARRVALAAAELGRRLARKREAQLAREQRIRASREASEREQRERTQEGPVALRSELFFGAAPDKLVLFGSRLSGELSLLGPLRLDVGGELGVGWLECARRLGTAEQAVSLAPSYRLVLGRSFDLDLGVRADALLLDVPRALSLDQVRDQDSTWSARLDGVARAQIRLARQVRLSFGIEAGGLLRSVSYVDAGPAQRLSGFWWGAALGLVITPPR
jgi:hypothetical protein